MSGCSAIHRTSSNSLSYFFSEPLDAGGRTLSGKPTIRNVRGLALRSYPRRKCNAPLGLEFSVQLSEGGSEEGLACACVVGGTHFLINSTN